eukprot:36150-Rhodomonas_salina.13
MHPLRNEIHTVHRLCCTRKGGCLVWRGGCRTCGKFESGTHLKTERASTRDDRRVHLARDPEVAAPDDGSLRAHPEEVDRKDVAAVQLADVQASHIGLELLAGGELGVVQLAAVDERLEPDPDVGQLAISVELDVVLHDVVARAHEAPQLCQRRLLPRQPHLGPARAV